MTCGKYNLPVVRTLFKTIAFSTGILIEASIIISTNGTTMNAATVDILPLPLPLAFPLPLLFVLDFQLDPAVILDTDEIPSVPLMGLIDIACPRPPPCLLSVFTINKTLDKEKHKTANNSTDCSKSKYADSCPTKDANAHVDIISHLPTSARVRYFGCGALS